MNKYSVTFLDGTLPSFVEAEGFTIKGDITIFYKTSGLIINFGQGEKTTSGEYTHMFREVRSVERLCE